MVEDLLQILHQCKPNKIDDEWVWKGRHGYQYTLRDAYNKLVNNKKGKEVRSFINCENTRVLPLQCYMAGEFSMTGCQLEIVILENPLCVFKITSWKLCVISLQEKVKLPTKFYRQNFIRR